MRDSGDVPYCSRRLAWPDISADAAICTELGIICQSVRERGLAYRYALDTIGNLQSCQQARMNESSPEPFFGVIFLALAESMALPES